MKSAKFSRFLPFEKYTIRTGLSQEEVTKRLRRITESTKPFTLNIFKAFNSSGAEYLGQVSERSFKISRVISYRNSFLPVIEGKVSTYLHKTEIEISMTLNLFVKVFLIIWFSLLGIPTVFILFVLIRRLIHFYFKDFSPFLLIPVGMFIFGYLLTVLAFKPEARISKSRLNELFEAEPETNPGIK